MRLRQKIIDLILDAKKRVIPPPPPPPPEPEPPPPPITANCDKAVLTLDAIDIAGWALSQDGIRSVEVSVDGEHIASAHCGCLRSDIAAAFPELNTAFHAGFCLFKVLEPQLRQGSHTLEITITSNDGHTDVRQFQPELTQTYDAFSINNPTVIVHCDRVSLSLSSIDMTGFVLSPQHIDRLNVYLDDRFLSRASLGIYRPDVEAMYPCYKDSQCAGFCLYYEFEAPIEGGSHTITLKALIKNGIEDCRQLSATAAEETPPLLDVVCDVVHFGVDAIDIKGFAASSMVISRVEVYIDDVFASVAPHGLYRRDIALSYPCYKDSINSGFCFYKRFDEPIAPGIHTIAATATTQLGHVALWSRQIEVAASYRELTNDSPNIIITSDIELLTFDVIEVFGWAVSPDGIKEIGVYVDGVFIDHAICGVPAKDVAQRHPCYSGSANAGFCLYKQLVTPLPQGQHIITLEALSNNGQIGILELECEASESYRSYTAQNPTFIAHFEKCLITCELIVVMGWIVTPHGLATAEIFIDGEFIGYAEGYNARPDIAALYPCYKNREKLLMGFDKILETPLSNGRHVLTLKATAEDGQMMSWNFEDNGVETYADYLMSTAPQVLIKLEMARMSLDFIEVKGWALSPDGIDKVEVYLDNGLIDAAYYGFERGDMKETFPLHKLYKNGANCGFCLYKKLDAPLETGYHTIKVEAVSATGLSKAMYEYNYINRAYKDALYNDSPIILSCDKLFVTLDVIEVEGWAASPDGLQKVEVYVDDVYIDKAFHGINTQQIGRLLPCYKGSAHSGFVLYSAYEHDFTAGDHLVTLKIISETGIILQWSTRYYVADSYEKYLKAIVYPPQREIQAVIDEFQYKPKISIVTPVYNVRPRWLNRCIQSVLDQYYDNWELCIYDDASTRHETIECLHKWDGSDTRIKIAFGTVNLHISGATNEALKMADGQFVALLDNDDELTKDALFENVKLLNSNPNLDFIYSDEDKLEEDGTPCDPFFKPDWSPELFCTMMYTCHLGLYRRSIMQRINGFRKGYEGSQDYDMVLRFVEVTAPERIAHIPKALYHWRKIYGSASESSQYKTYAFDSAIKALKDFMGRNAIEGDVINENNTGLYRIKRRLKATPQVSIIIPTKDKLEYLEKCVKSLINKTDYPNFEIIILDTGSVEPETREFYDKLGQPHAFDAIRIIDYPNPEFNYAQANNWAAQRAAGQYLLFLNNDTEVIERQWLTAMMEYGQLPEVGAVGAKLLYPDDSIQHMGVVVGLKRAASHVGRLYPDSKPMGFPFLHAKDVVRNVTAVTGACLLMPKGLFDELEGFDTKFRIAFNDIDLCLRVRKMGYKVIYTPYAKLYHHESVSVGKPYEDAGRCAGLFEAEVDLFRDRWDIENYIDPYFNKNLDESLRFKY